MSARPGIVLQSAAVASLLLCSSAAAQTPVRMPVQSLAALRPVLTPGERVIVTDSSGQQHPGKVSSLTDQLQLDQGRQRQTLFSEDAIRRIEKDDSTWDGTLIGFGVGFALGIAVAKNPSADSEGEEIAVGVAICVAGPFVGEWIDGHFHRVLFVSPRRTSLALVPLVGRTRVGVAAGFRF